LHPINLWDVTESFSSNRTVLGLPFCLPPLAAWPNCSDALLIPVPHRFQWLRSEVHWTLITSKSPAHTAPQQQLPQQQSPQQHQHNAEAAAASAAITMNAIAGATAAASEAAAASSTATTQQPAAAAEAQQV
jgi:hypothetical protein